MNERLFQNTLNTRWIYVNGQKTETIRSDKLDKCTKEEIIKFLEINEIKYESLLDVYETQIAIKFVKDTFQKELIKGLNLLRVTAPLFVLSKTGLNDNLNGTERPVSFDAKGVKDNLEVIKNYNVALEIKRLEKLIKEENSLDEQIKLMEQIRTLKMKEGKSC